MKPTRGFAQTLVECLREPQIMWKVIVSQLPASEQRAFLIARKIQTIRIRYRLKRAKRRMTKRDKLYLPKIQKTRRPPKIGELILCLFVSLDKQEDRLGDFEEMFTSLWLPKFGAHLARLVYLGQAIRSAGAIIRIGLITAVVDGVIRAIGK